jgi:hypothetical protein
MTKERRRALIYLALTFVVGLALGALIPGFLGRFHHREKMARPQKGGEHGLSAMIFRVVKPDSVQAAKMRPLIHETGEKIHALQRDCNGEVKSMMDSLRTKLNPMLNSEQHDKLEKFFDKGRRARMRR